MHQKFYLFFLHSITLVLIYNPLCNSQKKISLQVSSLKYLIFNREWYDKFCLTRLNNTVLSVRLHQCNLRSTASHLKTVGCLRSRYRLGHWWVSEMMLNVQSVLSSKNFYFEHKAINEAMLKLKFDQIRGQLQQKQYMNLTSHPYNGTGPSLCKKKKRVVERD